MLDSSTQINLIEKNFKNDFIHNLEERKNILCKLDEKAKNDLNELLLEFRYLTDKWLIENDKSKTSTMKKSFLQEKVNDVLRMNESLREKCYYNKINIKSLIKLNNVS